MIKKLTAILLAMLMVVPMMGMSATPGDAPEKNYLITNPYADVDWDEWGVYKTQLHCHTTASDGFLKIDEFVQKHYDLNFDIVALTDVKKCIIPKKVYDKLFHNNVSFANAIADAP